MTVSPEVNEATSKVEALNPELLGERVLFVLDPIGGGICPRERK
jgi:hypothetical protein